MCFFCHLSIKIQILKRKELFVLFPYYYISSLRVEDGDLVLFTALSPAPKIVDALGTQKEGV